VFTIERGLVTVGIGLIAYFSWKPNGERVGPYASGSVAGGLAIIGIGIVIVIVGTISAVLKAARLLG